jgi:hypothetical protein
VTLCAAGASGRIFQAAFGADMPFLRTIVSCLELKRERHFIPSFQHLRNQVRPFGTKLLSQLSGGCNY